MERKDWGGSFPIGSFRAGAPGFGYRPEPGRLRTYGEVFETPVSRELMERPRPTPGVHASEQASRRWCMVAVLNDVTFSLSSDGLGLLGAVPCGTS